MRACPTSGSTPAWAAGTPPPPPAAAGRRTPTPPAAGSGGNGCEENKTIWVGDLQYWMDENYLHNCFGPSGEGYIRLTAFGDAEATRQAVERIKTSL